MCFLTPNYKIKESFHPSYHPIVCFARLLFRSIYIAKTKEAMRQLDLYNKIKTLFAVFLLPFHLFTHFKTDTGNYTFAPRIARMLMCRYCFHVHHWMFAASPSVNDVMVTTFLYMQSQTFDKTLVLLCFNKTKETYLNVYKSYLYVSLKKSVRHYYCSVLVKY